MFWETLWPLVLGFGLSGAVQAFVSREAMQRKMGDHRPAAVARASGYGMVSSSCSYAASAMAKSLFVKGADFVAAMVFMFASTNLVIELGIVLVVLMGWQFAVSEFVGGTIMIVLLATARRPVAPGPADRPRPGSACDGRRGWPTSTSTAPAERRRLQRAAVAARGCAPRPAGPTRHLHHGRPHHAPKGAGHRLHRGRVPGRPGARPHVWNALFLHGHGFWTSLENVIVGPFIAIISFVCSIGNVPLAAALWKGGISFGGVISFIFADLIAFPLLLIYRRYYGTRLMLRMLVVFWALMSTAGLITEGIFRAAGLVPDDPPDHGRARPLRVELHDLPQHRLPGPVRRPLLAVPQPGALRRRRAATPRDPVCGMQVETAHAPASVVRDGRREYFCSDHCKERYLADAPV